MSEFQQFPSKPFYAALSNTTELQKRLKPFLTQFKNHNMQLDCIIFYRHWIYETIACFWKIFTSPKQQPIIKFNAMLAIKHCFDTCQYALVTLIQVFLLPKITEVALFRSKVKDQSSLVTYFTTEGYKQAQNPDLKKISFNYVMLAVEFVFASSQVKKFRCVQNIQIKQPSRYANSAQTLIDKGIKKPQKFSFFLPDYTKQHSAKYQQNLTLFAQQQICQIYSEYFLSMMITQLQSGKKGLLQIRSLLSYGDAYLTSAMINLCEDQLNNMPEGLQHKRKYLSLFNEFVRWGDIQAVIMVNNSEFVTKISVNVCTVRGDVNISQGENIYPEIQGKKQEKKEFYVDFLRDIETWADCIPLNQQGLQSNVRRIYTFLKQQKKFKFPQNLVGKRYKKQLQQNLKRNQQRNQKLLQIINNSQQQQQQSQPTKSHNQQTKRIQPREESVVNFDFLEDRINLIEQALEEIVVVRVSDKDAKMKLEKNFETLKEFKINWVEWLEKIDLDSSEVQEQDEEKLEEIILTGDQTMEAIQIIYPLIELYTKGKLSLEDFLKRMKQSLQIHQDLSMSRSKQMQLAKSLNKSLKPNLSNTIQKSILALSMHRVSKLQASIHQPLENSMNKSKPLNNLQKSITANNMGASLYKSNNHSGTSSIMRKSKMHSKLNKLKENAEALMQSRRQHLQPFNQKPSETIEEKKPNKKPFTQTDEYFRKDKQIGLTNQGVIKEQDKSSQFTNSQRNNLSASQENPDSNKHSSGKNRSSRQSRQHAKETQLKSSSSRVIESPGSSRNFKSEKNITVVSRNSQRLEVLEQKSKKLVAEMNLSDDAEKIVVEYSDIDEGEFEEKAHQREKQEIIKNEQRRNKKKELEQAFFKVKVQDNGKKSSNQHEKEQKPQIHSNAKNTNSVKKVQDRPNIIKKLAESKASQVSPSDDIQSSGNIPKQQGTPMSKVSSSKQLPNPLKQSTSQKALTNQYDNIRLSRNHIQPQPRKQAQQQPKPTAKQQVPNPKQLQQKSPILFNQPPTSKQRLSERIIPFSEEYGGRNTHVKKYDNVQTPKRSNNQVDKLEKTKKSESKISVVSDDKDDSMRSSRSIREKLKSRISQKKSIIKQAVQKSLESEIREMRRNEAASRQSSSLSRKKMGLQITQLQQKQKPDPNAQYSVLSDQHGKESPDLHKTKKISQTNQDIKLRMQQLQVQKQQNLEKTPRLNTSNLQPAQRQPFTQTLTPKPHRQGISLSLGKRGSMINGSSQQSLIKKPSILNRPEYQSREQIDSDHDGDLREEYFQNNLKKSKHSNRSRIKRKLQQGRTSSDSQSSCGDLIQLPDNRPLLDSHYANGRQNSGKKEDRTEFRKYIQNDIKKQLLCPKTHQIQQIINNPNKRQQIQQIIQHNPNNRKAKSQEKYFYGSSLRDKSTEKEVSMLQDKLKNLQNDTRKMKTKLAVRDNQINSFRNSSERGFMEFTNPSESNYFSQSDGFKMSRLGSEKGLMSPMTHQFLKSDFHQSSLIAQVKHAKATPFKQYFQKVKGNTFRKTLLKCKSLIEKQDQIEIGCMSVRKQDFSLEITIFITPLRFDLADINYSVIHDENLVSQSYPKKIVMIELKRQQKLHITMSVKKVPFSIPQFQLAYKSKSQYSTNYFRIPIPTLFNKFCLLQSLPLASLETRSFSPQQTMITSEFKLNAKVVKMQKVKEILTNFSYTKTKEYHVLTASGQFKGDRFLCVLKVNDKGHAIMEGVLEEGQSFKHLEFFLVTMRNILEAQR